MASLNQDNKGWQIRFRDPDTKAQQKIRLGSKIAKKTREQILTRVEYLITAKASHLPIEQETAVWLSGIGADLQSKLHRAGLIDTPASQSQNRLGDFLEHYLQTRTDVKELTMKKFRTTRDYLLAHFGSATQLKAVTPGDAEEWRLKLKSEGKAENTVRKHVSIAKQFFTAAKQKRLIAENSFEGMASSSQPNPAWFHFVRREVSEKVLDSCPDWEWRLLFAFARYGGLRVPSEPRELKWEDIHWEQNRVTVTSPKTAHHPGGETRVIPLFPELRPFLDDTFQEAEDGQFMCFQNESGYTATPQPH